MTQTLQQMCSDVDIVDKVETLKMWPMNDEDDTDFGELLIEIELRFNWDTDSLDWEPSKCTLAVASKSITWSYKGPALSKPPISDGVIYAWCKCQMTNDRIERLLDEDPAFGFVRATYIDKAERQRSEHQAMVV